MLRRVFCVSREGPNLVKKSTFKRRIYDLNKPEDRAYLLKRGFVWAVIYPHGEKRGKVISAHRDEQGLKFTLNYLRDVKVDVVKIAEYPDNLS